MDRRLLPDDSTKFCATLYCVLCPVRLLYTTKKGDMALRRLPRGALQQPNLTLNFLLFPRYLLSPFFGPPQPTESVSFITPLVHVSLVFVIARIDSATSVTLYHAGHSYY